MTRWRCATCRSSTTVCSAGSSASVTSSRTDSTTRREVSLRPRRYSLAAEQPKEQHARSTQLFLVTGAMTRSRWERSIGCASCSRPTSCGTSPVEPDRRRLRGPDGSPILASGCTCSAGARCRWTDRRDGQPGAWPSDSASDRARSASEPWTSSTRSTSRSTAGGSPRSRCVSRHLRVRRVLVGGRDRLVREVVAESRLIGPATVPRVWCRTVKSPGSCGRPESALAGSALASSSDESEAP